MRSYILSVWALTCLLIYCGGSDTGDTDKTQPASGKDSLIFPMRISGHAGYLYVDVKGTGGTPIVFAHSFGGSAEHWKHQVNHLQHERQVVTFDFRAHGRSDSAFTPGYTPNDLARDIAAVADFMQLKKFVLVGHSMGGSAAVAYTGRYPQKVAALVLVGTPGKSPHGQGKKIMASLHSPAYREVMDDYMQQLLQNARPEVETMVMHEFHQTSKPVAIAITGSIFGFDPLPHLAAYKGPLLIVSTARENQVPHSLARQVEATREIVIKGTSHWVQLDKPNEFNRLLDEFLKENKL